MVELEGYVDELCGPCLTVISILWTVSFTAEPVDGVFILHTGAKQINMTFVGVTKMLYTHLWWVLIFREPPVFSYLMATLYLFWGFKLLLTTFEQLTATYMIDMHVFHACPRTNKQRECQATAQCALATGWMAETPVSSHHSLSPVSTSFFCSVWNRSTELLDVIRANCIIILLSFKLFAFDALERLSPQKHGKEKTQHIVRNTTCFRLPTQRTVQMC